MTVCVPDGDNSKARVRLLGNPQCRILDCGIVTGSAWINGEIASRALLAMQEATVGATSQALRHIHERAGLHQILIDVERGADQFQYSTTRFSLGVAAQRAMALFVLNWAI